MSYPATIRLLFISIIETPCLFTGSGSLPSLVKFGKHCAKAANRDLGPMQGIFPLFGSLKETIFEKNTAICLFLSDPFALIVQLYHQAPKKAGPGQATTI